MEALNELEARVLAKLLNGDHPVLSALREQLVSCHVRRRDFTGVGFFAELYVPEDVASAPVESRSIRFGDVLADLDGVKHGVGFLLFVEDGRLRTLEAYTFGEPWPALVEVRNVAYTSNPRDFSALNRALCSRGQNG